MGADRKPVILFLHGFGSSSKCWRPLLALLRDDSRITERFELRTIDYPTKWFELNVLGRIPRLAELGRFLGGEIDSPDYRSRDLVLVGHSQGGLVIQTWFEQVLHANAARRLAQIRQVVLFATPNEGSNFAFNLRRILFKLFTNPQEISLRAFDPDIADLRSLIKERIVHATTDTAASWRVPVHTFCGMQDDIVLEASARGPFTSVKSLPGDHFGIIRPKDRQDRRYTEFVELLLEETGHAHRFVVERYETSLHVEPRPAQSSIHTRSEKNPRDVIFDNYGRLRRTVRFAPGNRCLDRFTIRYGTRKEGYVVGHCSHNNLVSPADRGLWEDNGTFVQFDFVPVDGEDSWFEVEIWKGFDAGERDVHFHLGNHSHYQHLDYVLDVSAYVAAGRAVTKAPLLYYHPQDHEHGELCRRRERSTPSPPDSATPDGVFRWQLRDVRTGIVDIVWDVAAAPVAPGDPPPAGSVA